MQGPYYTLCKTPLEYEKILKHLNYKRKSNFLELEKGAETKHFTYKGETVCIVCIADTKGWSKHEINALLVHESVHIWQQYCLNIGEKNPGREQEAYSIQKIVQELFIAFWTKKRPTPCKTLKRSKKRV